ncbi:MAG: transcriptional regulator [Candidatus Hadarchaeum yellowstonense]|jgi:Lrp/AsnC family transcriptional regulator for asnA, asnC and gidA|uniref:Transcriptional regulator n=1 Tax=Hadarchaeum yellowstonense TaxID=1776334 RepID=A0A147JSS3_HADYE|nr:MAG: transcriptional regulator [Candidatus Hadarchaeum yellowstonense]
MVDAVDLKIIRMLEEDGSLPFTKIARKLGLDESTVRKRVLSLKKSGVIRKFSIVVEPAKIGFNAVALVGVDVAPDKLLEIAERLAQMPETRYVVTSTGDHMIMTEIWARNSKELSQILSEKIGAIEGVKKICPAIVLEKIKG